MTSYSPDVASDLAPPLVQWQPRRRRGAGVVRIGAEAWAAVALLATVVGALALGAVAVGALAVGRLRIGDARLGRLEIDRLIVHDRR